MLELTATTDSGARLVALAESLGEELAARAPAHDRDGSSPLESVAALRDAGFFTAPIPAELGGLGVEVVHDLLVASSRLARADASVAIGVNMHVAAVLNGTRRRRVALAAGASARAEAFGAWLASIAREQTIMALAVSELGQDLTRPSTTATRHNGGWRIDGRKAFCTMAPAATVLLTAVTFTDERQAERYGYAQIPAGAPGVRIHDDWDALGMRASGSHSVSFEGVELPLTALRSGFRAGDPVPYMERNLTAGLFHASASLGIAEAALARSAAAVAKQGRGDDPRSRNLVSEASVELAACRSSLSRTAALVDAFDLSAREGTREEITALFTETQLAKAFINDAAARVVDRALALSGGAGYLNGSPLARAYRDVRAGAFMHPLGANRAHDLIADVALGREPALH